MGKYVLYDKINKLWYSVIRMFVRYIKERGEYNVESNKSLYGMFRVGI